MNKPSKSLNKDTGPLRGPTLTDAQGMGGVNAQDGFDYQIWDGLIRLPSWLRNPAFEGMIFEALEDLEARFFAPHAARRHVIDRFQAKSGQQTRAELGKVFESFRTFDAAHPLVTRSHTLVTPSLPATLEWLAADPDRVRRARPFYSPFVDVQQSSDDKLRNDLVSTFGSEIGAHFFERSEVALITLPDRPTALSRFSAELLAAFPESDFGQRKVEAAFSSLFEMSMRRRGELMTRRELLKVMRETLGSELAPATTLAVHVRSDRNEASADAVEIDASRFSGGESHYPDVGAWQRELLEPLSATAAWALRNGVRRIALTGQFRISTAFAVGWCFRSASGFEIDVPVKGGHWPTDARDPAPMPTNLVVQPPTALLRGRLIVSVGVLRDPRPDAIRHCGSEEGMSVRLDRAIVSASDAQAVAMAIKLAVDGPVKSLRAEGIDLYYLGPASVAVALGHRWNGMAGTRLHEFSKPVQNYVQTVTLG